MDVTVLLYYTVLISQQNTKHVRTCFGQKNDILKFGAQQNNPLSNTICIYIYMYRSAPNNMSCHLTLSP